MAPDCFFGASILFFEMSLLMGAAFVLARGNLGGCRALRLHASAGGSYQIGARDGAVHVFNPFLGCTKA
jgi:hypothetical protein